MGQEEEEAAGEAESRASYFLSDKRAQIFVAGNNKGLSTKLGLPHQRQKLQGEMSWVK